jgi:hypothetical protein
MEQLDLSSMVKRFQENYKANVQSTDIEDNDIFWTPVELVKTSFPESKQSDPRWLKEFGYYSLNLQQLEEGRSVPYGMLAREMFDYFFNEFVVASNQQKVAPNRFYFNSTAEFFNLIKGNPLGTKVSTPQRVATLEMLLNLESCAIRFKKKLNDDEVISNNNFFIREYRGPAHSKVAQKPSQTTRGEIEIELDFDTFKRLASSAKVPTKSYLVELAGSNVTARDLMIFIASQCYSLHKRNASHIDYDVRELSNVLGKNKDITIQRFNQDLKRALELLTKNYEGICPDDFFPAEIVRLHRACVYLRIYAPQNHRNILCA